VLIEFDQSSEVRVSCTDLVSLSLCDPFSQTSKRALVVGSRPSAYGTARMFQLVRHESPCVGIFVTMEEAEPWLEVQVRT
jgi:hypothetical protein